MKVLKKIWQGIKDAFTSCAVLLDESRNINEDGSWDKWWAKNRKAGK